MNSERTPSFLGHWRLKEKKNTTLKYPSGPIQPKASKAMDTLGFLRVESPCIDGCRGADLSTRSMLSTTLDTKYSDEVRLRIRAQLEKLLQAKEADLKSRLQ